MNQNIELEFYNSDDEGSSQSSSRFSQSESQQNVSKPNIFFVAIIHEFKNNKQQQLSRKDIMSGIEHIVKGRLKSNLKQIRSKDVKIEPILTTSILKACGMICVDQDIYDIMSQYSECLTFEDKKNGIQRTFDFKFLPYSQFDQCDIIDQGRFQKDFIPIKPYKESIRGVTIIVCINIKDQQIYALKKVQLKPSKWENLFNRDQQPFREVNALSRLSHPNILRLYSWWIEYETNEKNQRKYYIYEQSEYNTYLNCSDLLSFGLSYFINFPLSAKRNEIKSMAKQILSGLEYINSQGIFHRDLKIENILVTKDFKGLISLRICDFDWSKPHLNDDGQITYWTLQSSNAGSEPNNSFKSNKGAIYDATEELHQFGMILLDLCNTIPNPTDRANFHQLAKDKKIPNEFKYTFREETILIEALLSHKFKNVPVLYNSEEYYNFQQRV